MLESVIQRLHTRLGRRYALVAFGWVSAVAFVTGFMTLTAAIPYVDATVSQVRRLAPAWIAANTMSLVLVVIMARRVFRPVADWINGDRRPGLAEEAWDAAVSAMPGFLVRAVAAFSIVSIPAEIYAIRLLGLPWYGGLAAVFAVELTIVIAALLDYLGFELLMRPVLRELAADLSPVREPVRPSLPLRRRLLAGMVVTSMYGAGLGTAIGSASLPPAVKLASGLGFALLLTMTLVLAIASMLSGAVVTPVRDLVTGMRAVAAGDLDVRVPLFAADEIGFLARNFNRMVAGLAEREVLRAAMGTYVDPSVAERILAEGAELLGEEIDVSVLFLDIRDFTASADGQDPQETVAMLNAFFALVVPIVVAHGGHANKFLGDGLLAVFGAPQRFDDHADRAVAAAVDMYEAVRTTYASALRIGVGINSGRVVVGSVGGGGRLEFTLIGDTVNVAKRIEQLTKDLGDPILITSATERRLQVAVPLQARGSVPMRGTVGSVDVFALDRAAY